MGFPSGNVRACRPFFLIPPPFPRWGEEKCHNGLPLASSPHRGEGPAGDEGAAGAEIGDGGCLFLIRRVRHGEGEVLGLPPPLPLPTRGRGMVAFADRSACLLTFSVSLHGHGNLDLLPPPCGEGQGWGYTRQTFGIRNHHRAPAKMETSVRAAPHPDTATFSPMGEEVCRTGLRLASGRGGGSHRHLPSMRESPWSGRIPDATGLLALLPRLTVRPSGLRNRPCFHDPRRVFLHDDAFAFPASR